MSAFNNQINQQNTSQKPRKRNKVWLLVIALVGIGIFRSVLEIPKHVYENSNCKNFHAAINSNLDVPAPYKIIGRDYIECGNTFEGYDNKANYIFQSNQSSSDNSTVRANLVNIFTKLGWQTDISPNSAEEMTITLKNYSRLTGSVSIVGHRPDTFTVSFNVPVHLDLPPASQETLPEIKPNIQELIAHAPFSVYKPSYTPKFVKNAQFTNYEYTINYSGDNLQLTFSGLPDNFSIDKNCIAEKPCKQVANSTLGPVYQTKDSAPHTNAEVYLFVDGAEVVFYSNNIFNFDSNKEDILKLINSLELAHKPN